jgi:hypothetical protein
MLPAGDNINFFSDQPNGAYWSNSEVANTTTYSQCCEACFNSQNCIAFYYDPTQSEQCQQWGLGGQGVSYAPSPSVSATCTQGGFYASLIGTYSPQLVFSGPCLIQATGVPTSSTIGSTVTTTPSTTITSAPTTSTYTGAYAVCSSPLALPAGTGMQVYEQPYGAYYNLAEFGNLTYSDCCDRCYSGNLCSGFEWIPQQDTNICYVFDITGTGVVPPSNQYPQAQCTNGDIYGNIIMSGTQDPQIATVYSGPCLISASVHPSSPYPSPYPTGTYTTAS